MNGKLLTVVCAVSAAVIGYAVVRSGKDISVPPSARGVYLLETHEGVATHLLTENGLSTPSKSEISIYNQLKEFEPLRGAAFDREELLLYVSATYADHPSWFQADEIPTGRHIFKIELDNLSTEPVLVCHGDEPAISPDGRSMAYRRLPSTLNVLDLHTGVNATVSNDFAPYTRAVWLDDSKLLFSETSSRLSIFDLGENKLIVTDSREVVPVSVSPDLSMVVVLDKRSYPFALARFDRENYSITPLFEGMHAIWGADSSGFLYSSYPAFRNPLDDRPHLYFVSVGGASSLIQKYSTVYSGVHISP